MHLHHIMDSVVLVRPRKRRVEKDHAVYHCRDSVGPVAARLVTGYTIGAFIHVLLVIAIVLSGLVMLVIRQARQGKATAPVSNKTASYVRLQQPALFT
jgi:hypothetical protein